MHDVEAKNDRQDKHDEKCASVGALTRGKAVRAAARLEIGHDGDSDGTGAGGAPVETGVSVFKRLMNLSVPGELRAADRGSARERKVRGVDGGLSQERDEGDAKAGVSRRNADADVDINIPLHCRRELNQVT